MFHGCSKFLNSSSKLRVPLLGWGLTYPRAFLSRWFSFSQGGLRWWPGSWSRVRCLEPAQELRPMESHDPTEFGGSSSNSSDFRGRRSRGSGVVGGGSVGWLKRLNGTPVLGCHHDFKPFFKDIYVSIILTILTIMNSTSTSVFDWMICIDVTYLTITILFLWWSSALFQAVPKTGCFFGNCCGSFSRRIGWHNGNAAAVTSFIGFASTAVYEQLWQRWTLRIREKSIEIL